MHRAVSVIPPSANRIGNASKRLSWQAGNPDHRYARYTLTMTRTVPLTKDCFCILAKPLQPFEMKNPVRLYQGITIRPLRTIPVVGKESDVPKIA